MSVILTKGTNEYLKLERGVKTGDLMGPNLFSAALKMCSSKCVYMKRSEKKAKNQKEKTKLFKVCE